MKLLRAFAADMALMFREFGQCIGAGLRDFGHDIAAPFRDAAWLRAQKRRAMRGVW